jgi:hypothetical protein
MMADERGERCRKRRSSSGIGVRAAGWGELSAEAKAQGRKLPQRDTTLNAE